MKLFLISFILVFCALSSGVFAGDPPPLPVPQEDGLDILPPPGDLGQMTPVPLPGLPEASADAGESKKAVDAVTQAAPTTLSSTPTALPLAEQKKAPVSSPAPAPVPQEPAASNPGGLLLDYFPAAEGSILHYEYLKPAPGETVKKTRTVLCKTRTESADGAVDAVFETTEDGKSSEEKYSFFGSKAEDSKGLILQMPAKGMVVRWMAGGNYFKAVFGTAQVYQKTYPDCVIVTEKTKSTTHISYYAKGIGLVALEVYSKGLKLDQAQSFALQADQAK